MPAMMVVEGSEWECEDSAYASMPSSSSDDSQQAVQTYAPTTHCDAAENAFSLLALKRQMDAAFGFKTGLEIRVLGVPVANARSRVETQTKLCLQMVDSTGVKTSVWSHLRLPERFVTKEKMRKSHGVVDYSLIPLNKVLDVQAVIVCASDPKKNVQICAGCRQRELKRTKKRPLMDVKVENSQAGDALLDSESQKIVLFNCASYVDFSSGDTILPTRITCYCRHHNEKIGFCVYFIARDHKSTIIATGISPPILVTDDHKGTKSTVLKRSRGDDETRRPDSLPSSPPNTVIRPQFSSLVATTDIGRNVGMEFQDDILAEYIPAFISSESAAPLLECFGLNPEDADLMRPRKKVQSPPPANVLAAPLTAVINRIIPGEGPIQGGVEITILGENIHHGIVPVFGDFEAITTQIWGTTTLICILPPASSPGPVPVTFRTIASYSASAAPPPVSPHFPVTFMYKDDLDRSLMELALQVVGLRMTGSLDTARNIAMSIVNETAQETMNDSAVNFNELQRVQLETAILNALFSLEDVEAAGTSDEDDGGQDIVLSSLLDLTFDASTGLNMLHLAALGGLTSLVKYLISMDCEIDSRDRNGFTPLMLAVQAKNWEAIKILVKAGASPLLTSRNNVSVFGIAARQGSVEFDRLIECLIVEIGLDIKKANPEPLVIQHQMQRDPRITAPILDYSGLISRRNSAFAIPAVPQFTTILPSPPRKELEIDDKSATFSHTDLDNQSLDKNYIGSANKSTPGKLSLLDAALGMRWANPDGELKNIMDQFSMFNFLGPWVNVMTSPLAVQRAEIPNLLSENVVGRPSKERHPRQADESFSEAPFFGYYDEQHRCTCRASGSHFAKHEKRCYIIVNRRRIERRRRRRQQAVWLFWLPLFTLMLMMAMVWMMLTREEIDALFGKLIGTSRNTYEEVRGGVYGGKNLVFEFLKGGFGQL